MADIVEQLYGESPLGIPATILVPEMPEDAEFLEEFLTLLRDEKAAAAPPKRLTDEMVRAERVAALRKREPLLDAAIEALDLDVAD